MATRKRAASARKKTAPRVAEALPADPEPSEAMLRPLPEHDVIVPWPVLHGLADLVSATDRVVYGERDAQARAAAVERSTVVRAAFFLLTAFGERSEEAGARAARISRFAKVARGALTELGVPLGTASRDGRGVAAVKARLLAVTTEMLNRVPAREKESMGALPWHDVPKVDEYLPRTPEDAAADLVAHGVWDALLQASCVGVFGIVSPDAIPVMRDALRELFTRNGTATDADRVCGHALAAAGVITTSERRKYFQGAR